MPTKSQALRTAERKTLEFLRGIKADVSARKALDIARIRSAEKYDGAEYIARLALAGKAQKILNRVSAAVRDGRLDANDLDRKRLKELAGEGLKDYQANLLMRNALSTAYNAGYRQQGLADRTKAFWLYETKRDAQVRPQHKKWDGLLLEKKDPLAAQIFPPNGHNCRCRMVAVSRERAAQLVAAKEATVKKPSLKTVAYIDRVTGKTLRTLEGVDPGWQGAPDDSTEAIAALLERQLALLDGWKP